MQDCNDTGICLWQNAAFGRDRYRCERPMKRGRAFPYQSCEPGTVHVSRGVMQLRNELITSIRLMEFT